MADSWEESEDIVLAPVPKPTLRADAPSFSFNPGASKFSPVSFAPATQRAAAVPPGFASAAAAVVPDAQQQTAPPPPPVARPQLDHVMEDAQPAHDDATMEPEAERDAPGQQLLHALPLVYRTFRSLSFCLHVPRIGAESFPPRL